jgi:hypothetical protein
MLHNRTTRIQKSGFFLDVSLQVENGTSPIDYILSYNHFLIERYVQGLCLVVHALHSGPGQLWIRHCKSV